MQLEEQLAAKLDQLDEQLRLAAAEFPQPIALDRLRFAHALVRFLRMQVDLARERGDPDDRTPVQPAGGGGH